MVRTCCWVRTCFRLPRTLTWASAACCQKVSTSRFFVPFSVACPPFPSHHFASCRSCNAADAVSCVQMELRSDIARVPSS